MGKSNLLTGLSLDLETFKAHLKRISKEDYKVHQLDKDLLLEKTRQLYDSILRIEVAGEEKIEVKKVVEKTVKQEEIPKEIETEAVMENSVTQTEIIEEKPKVRENKETPETFVEEVPEPKQEVNIGFKENEGIKSNHMVEENTKEKKKPVNIEPQALPKDIGTEPQPQPTNKPKTESAYDLFSPSTNTVSDKFTTTEDKSIASKLKQNKLGDLRDAIGINEKFLFINELFNGDMGRYNKAIDEINSMQSKAGTDTYIMELKIEKQWDVESDAFIKFKELVDRKFN